MFYSMFLKDEFKKSLFYVSIKLIINGTTDIVL